MNKLITFLLFFYILACSKEELIIDKLEKNTVTTRSAGNSEYDLLDYGYNCFYSDFRVPLYAKAQI